MIEAYNYSMNYVEEFQSLQNVSCRIENIALAIALRLGA